MPEYKCERCGKIFDHKSHYEIHINRKIKCEKNETKIEKKLVHRCIDCETEFSRQDSLKRHEKICIKRKEKIEVEKIEAETVVVNKGSNSKIVVKKDNIENVLIKDNIENVVVNNININIVVGNHPTGFESVATSKGIKTMLESEEHPIVTMLRLTNLNPEKPEYHNVYYKDLHSSTCEVYTNDKWNTKQVNEVIETLIDNGEKCLKEIKNDIGAHLCKNDQERLDKALIDADHPKVGLGNTKSRKNLKHYIKNLLYDESVIVEKTRKFNKNINTFCENANKNHNNIDDDNDEEILKSLKSSKKWIKSKIKKE